MKPLYKKKYPNLFRPLTITRGKETLTFKNRIFVGPMMPMTGVDGNGLINHQGIHFYGDFAAGGFGSVTVSVPLPKDGPEPRCLTADFDLAANIDLNAATRLIHAYGAKASMEFGHPGPCMSPKSKYEALGASNAVLNGNPVRAMNYSDMEAVADLFTEAAILAKCSGFDAIMLHYGHGILMHNFLSPLTNRRTDEFGGSVENRVRFPRMVIERIREAVGDMPIELRMDGHDGTPGGITPEDAAEQILLLEDLVDMVHLSCGNRLDASTRPLMTPTHFVSPYHNVKCSEIAKKYGAKIPIGVVGGIHDPELAESIVDEGKADYIYMARQAIADAEWVNKVRNGQEDEIRPCLRCTYCLDHGRRGALTEKLTFAQYPTFDMRCAVNPLYGQGEIKKEIPFPKVQKSVAIVGGGIAGMQAALAATEHGHRVTLYEKTDQLGGQVNYYHDMWFKKEIKKFKEYLIRRVCKENITVKCNTTVTPELFENGDFDSVIVAIGSEPLIPNIKGIDRKIVVQALDVFGNEQELGKNLVFVGGGMVACELAIHLMSLSEDHNITIVEESPFLAGTAELTERTHTLQYLDQYHVLGKVNSRCIEITDTGIIAEEDGKRISYDADRVILCTGMKAKQEESRQFEESAFDVLYVGDCEKASDIVHAVCTGYDAGITL